MDSQKVEQQRFHKLLVESAFVGPDMASSHAYSSDIEFIDPPLVGEQYRSGFIEMHPAKYKARLTCMWRRLTNSQASMNSRELEFHADLK